MFIQRKIAAILSRPKKRKKCTQTPAYHTFQINKESLGEAGLFFWPVQLHPDDGSVRMNICHCFLSLTHSTAWQILLPLFCIIIIIIISGLHYYECVAPLVANSLQSGQFWARSTASVHDSLRESRSFCPSSSRSSAVVSSNTQKARKSRSALHLTLSFIQVICPNRVRRRAWIISVSKGWLVWR